ncbi:MAG: anaerobic ribonucleoside-triphosphate reductase [Bacillota bacterium]
MTCFKKLYSRGKTQGGKIVSKKQKCEVYSRVVGYLSPVSDWNKGKKEEFKDRKTFSVKKDFSS